LIAAIGLLALVAGGFYLLGRRGGSPAGIGAAGRPAVAVMAFENPSGAADVQWLTSGLPSMLLTGLGQTSGLDVVSSQRVDEVLKDLGVNAASLERAECSRSAGALARCARCRHGVQDRRRPAHRRAGRTSRQTQGVQRPRDGRLRWPTI
jgi:hypothetical protein